LAIIAVDDLHYSYPPLIPGGDPIPVLRGVDLRLERGAFVALMGPTAVGKSTLCLALNGIVPQSTGGVIRGQVRVAGYDTRRTPIAEMAPRIGLVGQDPESQLFCTTVEREVAFGPENLALPRPEIVERVAWALETVGLSECAHRSPLQLSGGQKQRLAIAASLALLPEILILDEPTASLDPLGQRQVFQVVERLRRQREMTILMVSHNAEQIAQFADRLAIMIDGRIVRDEAPRALLCDADLLREAGLAPPQVTAVAQKLNTRDGGRRQWIRLDEARSALQPQRGEAS